MKLTPALAEEIRYRLDIVACEPDLLEDYGLTAPQVEALIATVPDRGEWTVPDWAVHLVAEEVSHAASQLRDCAYTARKMSRESDDHDEAERLRKEAGRNSREARALEGIVPTIPVL